MVGGMVITPLSGICFTSLTLAQITSVLIGYKYGGFGVTSTYSTISYPMPSISILSPTSALLVNDMGSRAIINAVILFMMILIWNVHFYV